MKFSNFSQPKKWVPLEEQPYNLQIWFSSWLRDLERKVKKAKIEHLFDDFTITQTTLYEMFEYKVMTTKEVVQYFKQREKYAEFDRKNRVEYD